MEEDIIKRRRISNYQIQKRAEEDEDRISALPDSLIHHILSFLPFKDAVKTSVLSKRWEFLWTWVQNLIFRFRSDYERFDEFSAFVNRALILYSPVKVNKFVVDFDQYNGFGSCVDFWVRFAITRDVEELSLHFLGVEDNDFPLEKAHDGACLPFYMLPQFIYESSSVSKLSFKFCNFSPEGQISWTLLKVLSIGYVELSDDVMQKILLGSPALEFLELYRFQGINRLDITSKRLKKLVMNEIWDSSLGRDDSTLEISAPNLLSLSILGYIFRRDCRLINVSSLVDATFDFERMVYKEDIDNFYRKHQNMVNQLLEKVCHVRELTLGSWCIQVVSIREVIRLPSPLSKCKCLILGMDCVDWDMPGVASLLHSSPEMEKLVINMAFPGKKLFDFDVDFYNSYEFEKNYWTSQKRILKCLLPHLETIEVVGLEESRPYYYEFALELMEFLLKNAKVLKKLVLMDNNHNDKGRRHDLLQAAQKLSSFPRCSPHAVIRVPT